MSDMFTSAVTKALKTNRQFTNLTVTEVPSSAIWTRIFGGGTATAVGGSKIAPFEGSGGSGGSAGDAAALPSGPAAATLIDSIPYVDDGDVIRAEQYNDLLSGLRLIARLLDTGAIEQAVTVSAAPVLLPVLDQPAFRLDEGFARGPAEDKDTVVGWLPLDLPDGATIDSLRLRGAYPGTALTDWPVSLRRVEHGKQDDKTVLSGNLKSATTAFGTVFDLSFAFDARGLSRADADELSRVDTGKYRYQFHTTLSKAQPAADAKLFTIQVECVRS